MISPAITTLLQKVADAQNLGSGSTADPAKLSSSWYQRVVGEVARLYDRQSKLNFSNLSQFRRLSIFVSDSGPYSDFASGSLSKWLSALKRQFLGGIREILRELIRGERRGIRNELKIRYALLEKEGATRLLRKYPVSQTPGAPFSFEYKGCSFNGRSSRHAYLVNLLQRFIGKDLETNPKFISLDLGCSYGMFTYFLKSEYPKSTHVLVDFPDQILLALYFLASAFPEAKIATLPDYERLPSLSRDYLQAFDFVFVPIQHFKKIEGGSIDLFTNFLSLGEMKREWFNHYMESPAFRGAKYFYTCNRVVSAPRHEPTHDTDIHLLDYPFHAFEKLHFDICPLFITYPQQFLKFFYRQIPYSSQQFEFIGKRNPSGSANGH